MITALKPVMPSMMSEWPVWKNESTPGSSDFLPVNLVENTRSDQN